MKTAIIYDENILDSFMAAACVTSVLPCKTFERKELPLGDFETYVWIGVLPTKFYFPGEHLNDVKECSHVSILTKVGTDTHMDMLENVIFLRDNNNDKEFIPNFGSRTLTEKALAFFDIDPVKFCGVVDTIRNFYKADNTMEQVENCVLNAVEALNCLHNNEPYSYIGYDPESCEAASEKYQELMSEVNRALNHRGLKSNIKIKEDSHDVYTFYESKLWWLIEKRLRLTQKKYRNVSVAVTGTVILGSLHIVRDFENYKPVFIHQ